MLKQWIVVVFLAKPRVAQCAQDRSVFMRAIIDESPPVSGPAYTCTYKYRRIRVYIRVYTYPARSSEAA